MKTYTMDMTEGPVLSKILIFALPLIFSNILQVLFNAADIIIVGKFVGDVALAAVGSNSALINLITNLFIGLSVGANVIVARFFGANREKETSSAVHTSIALGIVSGIFLTVIGVLGAPLFLGIMKTPDDVLPQAVLYLRIYFLGMTSTMVYNFGSAVLRSVGDTKRPLYYLLTAGILNVVLNVIFVAAFNLGVAGVALATIISQTLSCILVLACLSREKSFIRLELKKLAISYNDFIEIIKVGLPAGFQGIVFALSNTVIQSSVNSFGSVVMAGSASAQNLEGMVYLAMNAFHQSALTFSSQSYGAKKYKRINTVMICSLACVTVCGAILGGSFLLTGKFFISLFSKNPDVIEAGFRRVKVIMSTYYFCGIMDVLVGGLRGIGYSVMPMIVSLIGACGCRLLWLATVFQIERFHTQETVYMSYPISWIITLSVHAVCYIVLKRRIDKENS